MVHDRKIKRITEYFSRKREVEKTQLANFREHSGAVAFSKKTLVQKVKDVTHYDLSESAKTSLIKKSQKSNIPFNVIKEVYRRGVSSWDENVNKTPQQLGFERVNSFISKGQTYFNEDYDLSFNLQLNEKLSKKTLTDVELAKLHKLPLHKIKAEIAKGEKVEKEHTKNIKLANEIARDHIKEDPRYYEKLAKVEKNK